MTYFIKKGEDKVGPFPLEELARQAITKETLVWYIGLSDWTKAGEILELLDIVDPKTDKKPVAQLLKELGHDYLLVNDGSYRS